MIRKRLIWALEGHRDQGDRGIKVDVPDFHGRLHPEDFLDWLGSVEKFFDWKELSEFELASCSFPSGLKARRTLGEVRLKIPLTKQASLSFASCAPCQNALFAPGSSPGSKAKVIQSGDYKGIQVRRILLKQSQGCEPRHFFSNIPSVRRKVKSKAKANAYPGSSQHHPQVQEKAKFQLAIHFYRTEKGSANGGSSAVAGRSREDGKKDE
ncbi:hypothetical protein ACOSQ2_003261 [Xanthoceras sorbifolium]